MTPQIALIVLLLALGSSGCEDSRPFASPASPSNTTRPITIVQGFVYDTLFRPLAGVLVKAVGGSRDGTSTTSDGNGRFQFPGNLDDAMEIRASSDGYLSATHGLGPNCVGGCNPNNRSFFLVLGVIAPPVSVAGDYDLTLVADPSCTELPAAFRTRTYAAMVKAGAETAWPAGTFFDLVVESASLNGESVGVIGVAGNSIALSIGGEGREFLETVAPNTYLRFDGRADALAAGSSVTTLSASFDGVMGYCELASANGNILGCAPAARRVECASKSHQLTLRRR